jgi:hypothetical protein
LISLLKSIIILWFDITLIISGEIMSSINLTPSSGTSFDLTVQISEAVSATLLFIIKRIHAAIEVIFDLFKGLVYEPLAVAVLASITLIKVGLNIPIDLINVVTHLAFKYNLIESLDWERSAELTYHHFCHIFQYTASAVSMAVGVVAPHSMRYFKHHYLAIPDAAIGYELLRNSPDREKETNTGDKPNPPNPPPGLASSTNDSTHVPSTPPRKADNSKGTQTPATSTSNTPATATSKKKRRPIERKLFETPTGRTIHTDSAPSSGKTSRKTSPLRHPTTNAPIVPPENLPEPPPRQGTPALPRSNSMSLRNEAKGAPLPTHITPKTWKHWQQQLNQLTESVKKKPKEPKVRKKKAE